MPSEFGNKLRVSIFGQSHGEAIGCVVNGFPAGEAIDFDALDRFLGRRRGGKNNHSTARAEADKPEFLSGVMDGKTCAFPLCAIIKNADTRSKDYSALKHTPRPGHADLAAHFKWGDNADMRGGGHFSGRLTAPICIAGGIAKQILERKGVFVGAHVSEIAGHFGRRKILEIKAMDIEIFLKKLRRDGRSDSCLAQCRGMLFQIFNKAEANDLVKKNPVRFAEKMRKRPAKRKEAFTAEEVKLLLENLPEDQVGWGIRLMLCTGMRTQELLGLEPRHIAEDGSYIVIEQAVVMEKGTAVIGTPKSQDSYRTVPIPKSVRYCARLLRNVPTKYCWERGKPDMPCNPSYFRKKFKEEISSVEGVRVLTPHSCRHTYVSQMQALGIDLATIQSLVGHADVDMTKHYLHVQDPVRLNAIAVFDDAFFEKDQDVHRNIIDFVKSS